MKNVFLALGSNMGDRIDALRRALDKLHPEVVVRMRSKVYESEPMDVGEQPRFYNMVVAAETALEPLALLEQTQRIETLIGRAKDTHNMPRPIDIDILLYEDDIIETPHLVVPHPRMHERAFVMMPLEEIASFYLHPKLRRPIIDLWDEIGSQGDTLWEAEEQI